MLSFVSDHMIAAAHMSKLRLLVKLFINAQSQGSKQLIIALMQIALVEFARLTTHRNVTNLAACLSYGFPGSCLQPITHIMFIRVPKTCGIPTKQSFQLLRYSHLSLRRSALPHQTFPKSFSTGRNAPKDIQKEVQYPNTYSKYGLTIKVP